MWQRLRTHDENRYHTPPAVDIMDNSEQATIDSIPVQRRFNAVGFVIAASVIVDTIFLLITIPKRMEFVNPLHDITEENTSGEMQKSKN